MRPLILALLLAHPVHADAPQITHAAASQTSTGWRFNVTIAHPDTGWDHYADGWRIEDSMGNVLGLRVLAHPHVNEQPFTRALGSVAVPDGTDTVYIRSRCIVDGWSQDTFAVPLPQD